MNESQGKRLEFWNMFNQIIDERGNPFNKRKATTDHWYSVAVGSSQCHISIDLVNKEHKIRVGLWIPDNKDLFDSLYANKADIEAAFGKELHWNRLDNKKASLACVYIKGLNFNNQDNYRELMDKIIDNVISLKTALTPYL